MRLEELDKIFKNFFEEIAKVIVGQRDVLEQFLLALLCDAHALVEGYPGLAKTLAAKSIAQLLDLKFSRIQGTPDLMPSDILGTYILEEEDGKKSFRFQSGPIFANVVLVDEINRATPKTQSALLEAMQERQITLGNATYKLEKPFLVLATQNPIEMEGVFSLPEAQRDRFIFKILINYPDEKEEVEIVNRYAEELKEIKLKPIISKAQLLQLQDFVRQVPIANEIKRYALEIVRRTRAKPDLIEYGASPRASIYLILAAKARALIAGRKYVSKDDINYAALPVLRHRIILTFEAERQGKTEDEIIKSLLK